MTDRIEGVNRSRIKWCCDERDLSIEELFHQLGISERTLNEFIEDKPALTFTQLEKIARTFNRGVLFFLEPEPVDPVRVHTPQFRTIMNQKPTLSPLIRTLIEKAEKQRDIYMAVQEELGEESLKPWRQRLPRNIREGSIGERALAVREWLDLEGVKDFEGYRQKVETQGVLVFLSNGYAGSWQIPKESTVRGFSLAHDIHPVIFIKKQRFPAPQTFTLFHELAHLILHRKSFADEDEDLFSYQGKEKEANEFAGMILVPDKYLDQVDVKLLRIGEIENLDADLENYRKAWGVSTEVILRRLMDEKKISKLVYQSYRQWTDANPIPEQAGGGARHRFSEPLRIFGRSFVGSILEAVGADRLSLNKACGFLDNIKVSDIHRLEERRARL